MAWWSRRRSTPDAAGETAEDAPKGSYFAESFQWAQPDQGKVPQEAAAPILRARILLHLLFTDRLVIPDSQMLGNPPLRGLLWHGDAVASAPSDLAELLTEGRLLVARRDTVASLTELREEQLERRVVPNLPSTREYSEHLDALIGDKAIDWNFESVSTGYKPQALRLLRARLEAAGGSNPALDAAYAWIDSRDLLYYADFLAWQERVRSELDPRELAEVDRLVAAAYPLNFATTVGLDMAGPAGSASPFSRIQLTADEHEPVRMVEADCYAINPFVLSRIPVQVILAAIESEPRQTILAEFAKARQGGQTDWTRVESAFQELMSDLNAAVFRLLDTADLEAARAEFARTRPKARLMWSSLQEGTDAAIQVTQTGMTSEVEIVANLILLGLAVVRDVVHARHRSSRTASELERKHERLLRAQAATPDELLVRFPRQRGAELRRLVASPTRLEHEAELDQ